MNLLTKLRDAFSLEKDRAAELPIAPSIDPVLINESIGRPRPADRRTIFIGGLAVAIAIVSTFIAQFLIKLISLITNIAFYQRISWDVNSPADNHLGWMVVLVPAIGGIIVGFMARYGSRAIRGHGIPEAMEQVLTNKSRIPARLTFLKPLSAAIAIGTGGPFGAEGPIIATGGALGSLVGQLTRTTSEERKALLASGAAAGMTATFGSPVSAIILAIELLVFEFRPRSFIPICMASATAAAIRLHLVGPDPVFSLPNAPSPTLSAIGVYFVLGLFMGVLAVFVTKLVYTVEEGFEHLRIHWMWWPAIGGLVVGAIGYFSPHTLGVGYDNIDRILSGNMGVSAVMFLCVMKLISWSISLGSGTSGGTLAPLFTIGGGMGIGLGTLAVALVPGTSMDLRVAALVGMAAIFAGASRALLASILFAFETTREPAVILPLLSGCTGAFLISCLRMANTLMTEKIVRRGVHVPSEYLTDQLAQITVGDAATLPVITLESDLTLEKTRQRLEDQQSPYAHQGFPVINQDGDLMGMVTRKRLLDSKEDSSRRIRDIMSSSVVTVFMSDTLRDAAHKMARYEIGRLPVIDKKEPKKVIAILTRSDLLSAYRKHLDETQRPEVSLSIFRSLPRKAI